MSVETMEADGASKGGEIPNAESSDSSQGLGSVKINANAPAIVNDIQEKAVPAAEEEVEALSHKQVRLKKKAEKQAARAALQVESNTTAATRPLVHPSRAATIASANTFVAQNTTDRRSKYSVWVGNLSFRTSSERLREWFEQHDIQGISRINMPNGQRKQDHNRGFAYVDIPSAEVIQRCINLSESHLEGRKLLIKAGADYTGRPEIDQKALDLAREVNVKSEGGDDLVKGKTGLTKTAQKILRAQKHSPGPTLFVGNLSFNTTEQGLREMVERSAMARSQRKVEKAKGADTRDEQGGLEQRGDSEEDDSDDDSNSDGDDGKNNKGKDTFNQTIELSLVDRAAERKKRKEEKAKQKGLRGAGIRKVRMGQFEDTGKCKGFAFIDFFTPAYATASLIDPRNSKLDGRELSLQYAGAEAIRRGAPKGQTGGLRPNRKGFKRSHREAFAPDFEEAKEILGPAPEIGSFDPDAPLPKKHKETKEERIKRREAQSAIPNRRAKPGAALANAPRGKTGIIVDAPVGIKKTFD